MGTGEHGRLWSPGQGEMPPGMYGKKRQQMASSLQKNVKGFELIEVKKAIIMNAKAGNTLKSIVTNLIKLMLVRGLISDKELAEVGIKLERKKNGKEKDKTKKVGVDPASGPKRKPDRNPNPKANSQQVNGEKAGDSGKDKV